MKGIKLTPFLLFVILLVVLVLAMLFGSVSKPIFENMEGSNSTNSWSTVPSSSMQVYNSGTQLEEILPILEGDNGMFFDPNNGNVIVTNNLASDTYTLLSRDSSGTPVMITASAGAKESVATTLNLTTAPWTFVSGDFSILYCPYKANTLIIVIDNTTNMIKQIFKSSKGISTSTLPINTSTGVVNTIEASKYAQLGVQVKEQITINGKNENTTKIANNVYYSDTLGIAVGSPGNVFDTAEDFQIGVSRQNTDNILVLSTLLDEASLLAVIIVKEPNSNVYKVASANFIKHSFSEGNPEDSFSLTVESGSESGSGSGSGSGPGSGSGSGSGPGSGSGSGPGSGSGSKDKSNKSCNSQYDGKPSYICPNNNNSSGSDNSDYIKKTEIVPPVCPGCPPCPNVTPASCNLSINSNGEIVDCTGKKYEPEGAFSSASPAEFGGIGSTVSSVAGDISGVANNTVNTAGDVVEKGLDTATGAFDKTLDTAGNVLETTVDGAGNVLETTFDGAGNIVGELGDTVGDIASGIGQGVGEIGTGASDLVQGISSDVAGLGNNVIDSTTGLLKSTGEGIVEMSQQQQQQMIQQQQQMLQGYMQQGYMQQMQQMQQPQQMQQGYPMQQGMGYSYPQTCPRGGSNYVPITNDFSQFS